MPSALPDQNQRELFWPLPADLIDMRHELALPANRVDWNYFETEFSPLYATGGQPGVPVRLMVGRLLLKQMKNLGDQTLAKEWIENPAYLFVYQSGGSPVKRGYRLTRCCHARRGT